MENWSALNGKFWLFINCNTKDVMNTKECLTAWTVDELDPDNWLRIPDFGVNPQDVEFKGFALPINTPSGQDYGLRHIIREQVRTARVLIRKQESSLSEIQADFVQVQDMIKAKGESEKLNPSRRQVMAALYMLILQNAEIAVRLINAKSPISLEVCYGEIAKCAEGIRSLMLLSSNGKDESLNFIVTRLAQHFKAQRQASSEAGKSGVPVRTKGTTALKEWALGKALGSKKADAELARDLSGQIPAHLADVSSDPKRLIYDALRAQAKLKLKLAA